MFLPIEEQQLMKRNTAVSIIAASMLALTSVASHAEQGMGRGGAGAGADQNQQFDRDRVQDRTHMDAPDQDRDRDRERVHLQDPLSIKDQDIYGGALMNAEERNQYRKELSKTKTVQAREKFQKKHEKNMQARAQQQGKDLVPPGQGPIYGGEHMSVQERNEYREKLRLSDSEENKQKFMAQHKEEMQLRIERQEREAEEAE
jgi:hypothetical protein